MNTQYNNGLTAKQVVKGTALGTFFALFLAQVIYWIFVGSAYYSIWSADMNGRARFALANQDREIMVREATAKRDAAKLLAEVEVERAKGVAAANKIVQDGLGGAEGYLRYLYIQQLGNADKNERTIIYVPTEGLLPITEAGRGTKK